VSPEEFSVGDCHRDLKFFKFGGQKELDSHGE
jgi:hypothetical protein